MTAKCSFPSVLPSYTLRQELAREVAEPRRRNRVAWEGGGGLLEARVGEAQELGNLLGAR
jgi:hypothetical protein